MNVEQLIKQIVISYKANRPILALSSPGVGKSSAVYQAASTLSGMYGETFKVIEVRAATSNPAELADIKFIVDGVVCEAKQGWVPTTGRGIIFLDEIADGTPSTQSALQQLALDRRIGSAKLGDGWGVVSASNRQSDKAAAGRVSTAFVNRGACVTIEPDTDCFVKWALDNKAEPLVIAYSRWRPGCWNFDPSVKSANLAFCSPRSMHILSDYLKADPNLDIEMISGIVGDAVGAEIAGFRDLQDELEDLDYIIANPEKAKVSQRIDVAIATIYALLSRVNEDNANNILIYFSRQNAERKILAVIDFHKMNSKLLVSQPQFLEISKDPQVVRLLTSKN